MVSCQKEIPVVFAADSSFVAYVGVAISSLISSSNKENHYQVYILHTTIVLEDQKRLESLSVSNVVVKCVDVSEKARRIVVDSCNHLSVEATYRILIPDILPQYDKVIYVDSDTVILRDLKELYDIDLGNCILGAVKHIMDEFLINYYLKLTEQEVKDIFNSGVLIINTNEFKKNRIKDKCIDLLLQDMCYKYKYLDQDVLNITCKDSVKYLDERWNVTWYHLFNKPLKEYREIFERAIKDPYIIHYASKIKAWNAPERYGAEFFWQYARKTIFYEEILFANIMKSMKKNNKADRFLFPFRKVKKGSLIVLYGAGEVGNSFYKQIQITNYGIVVLWADKNYKALRSKGIEVSDPKYIEDAVFDVIIIANEKKKTAEQIAASLRELGIPENKIIWSNPLRNKEEQ